MTDRANILRQLGTLAVCCAVAVLANAADVDRPTFELDIQPIFKAHCIKCHGDRDPEGGLNLTSAAGLLKGGDEGPVVVEGTAERSLLFRKIDSHAMPPPEENDTLTDEQIALVGRWLDNGTAGVKIAVPMIETPRVITEADRDFWAFRRPVSVHLPAVSATQEARNPIDRFLLERLEAKGLSFSSDAERRTLLRRAYLDLIGIPPSPEEIQTLFSDGDADSFERLVDRLLGSPQYGERWGRHWLDVAGYTDSPHWNADKAGNMQNNDDWLYRDYVIRSFNRDKPFDRFLTEQLAGDELVDWRSASDFSPEILDALIATGYLRTTPDWTHTDGMPSYRFDTLARVVDNVSTGLLGLTMGCARCHSHKFDPIPHEDYYRLMAVFATAYNPEEWLRPVDRYLADVPPQDKELLDRHNADVETKAAEVRKQLEELRAPHRRKLFSERLATMPEVLRGDIETALATQPLMRDEVQRYLVQKFETMLKVSDQDVADSLTESERSAASSCAAEIGALLSSRRQFVRIQGLCDVGKPPALRQLIRGDARTPGKAVEPGFPTILCPPGQSAVVRPPDLRTNSSGRRLALARWLTSRDNPLVARVMVNRVWQHHFGTGIVATPENFGHSGIPPTHPELLDWLAVDFMEHDWSVKHLHRTIMMSTAYRQSAHRTNHVSGDVPQAQLVDPENELLWRMNLRRLEAEALRDSVLSVSGKLNAAMGGPPIPVESNADGLVTVSEKVPTSSSQWRRSVYVRSLRGSHPGGQGFKLSMFEIFDFPEVVINCTRRTNSTTPLQSLALLNSKFMLEQARYFAEHVIASAGADSSAEHKIEMAFILAYSREPNSTEMQFCLDHLNTQSEIFSDPRPSSEAATDQALVSLCLMLLASNEFLYNG